MKKYICLFLSLILTIALSACEVSSDINDKTPVSENGNTEISNDVGDQNSNKPEELTIAETVIFDSNDIKITVKGLKEEFLVGQTISLLIENNSANNISVHIEDSIINGYMSDISLYAEVAAGKKANESAYFSETSLENCGIETLKDIEFRIRISNSDTYDTILTSDVITLQTSATAYVQNYDDSGIVVYDANDIKIIAKKLNSSDNFWGADLYFYVENNRNQKVTISAEDTSINGFMIDGSFYSEICSGKKAVDSMTFFESDLEDQGITSIDEIELKFHIYDSNTYDTITDTDIITITFE